MKPVEADISRGSRWHAIMAVGSVIQGAFSYDAGIEGSTGPVTRWKLFRRHPRLPGTSDNRAVAAVEFAIVAPILITFLAAASDYGLAMWSRSCLSNAVAQGAYYAFVTGTTVTASNIVKIVENASSLTGITATASVPATCYCPSGSPATLGTAVSCTSTCSDGTPPGNYLTIVGTYTLAGYFLVKTPFWSPINGTKITDTVTVRLQ